MRQSGKFHTLPLVIDSICHDDISWELHMVVYSLESTLSKSECVLFLLSKENRTSLA